MSRSRRDGRVVVPPLQLQARTRPWEQPVDHRWGIQVLLSSPVGQVDCPAALRPHVALFHDIFAHAHAQRAGRANTATVVTAASTSQADHPSDAEQNRRHRANEFVASPLEFAVICANAAPNIACIGPIDVANLCLDLVFEHALVTLPDEIVKAPSLLRKNTSIAKKLVDLASRVVGPSGRCGGGRNRACNPCHLALELVQRLKHEADVFRLRQGRRLPGCES
jgi:hypothetical protein